MVKKWLSLLIKAVIYLKKISTVEFSQWKLAASTLLWGANMKTLCRKILLSSEKKKWH